MEAGCHTLLGGKSTPLHHIVRRAEITPGQYQKLSPMKPTFFHYFATGFFDNYGKVNSTPGVKIIQSKIRAFHGQFLTVFH